MTIENDKAFLLSIDSAITKLDEMCINEELERFENGFAFRPEKLEALKLSMWALKKQKTSLTRKIQKARRKNSCTT